MQFRSCRPTLSLAALGLTLRLTLRRVSWVGVAIAFTLLSSGVAHACPVCFGDPDSPMVHGMNNGILALLGVVAVVQGGFVALFISIWRRGKRLQERKDSFRIIKGGIR